MRLRIRVSNPMYAYRHTYASYIQIPEYYEYEGEIVSPKPKWLSDNQFMMDTGTDESVLRVLDKDRIVNGWLMPDQPSSENKKYVKIPGKSGKQYTVTLSEDNTYFRCNCTGYGYRRHCSHVEEVMSA